MKLYYLDGQSKNPIEWEVFIDYFFQKTCILEIKGISNSFSKNSIQKYLKKKDKVFRPLFDSYIDYRLTNIWYENFEYDFVMLIDRYGVNDDVKNYFRWYTNYYDLIFDDNPLLLDFQIINNDSLRCFSICSKLAIGIYLDIKGEKYFNSKGVKLFDSLDSI